MAFLVDVPGTSMGLSEDYGIIWNFLYRRQMQGTKGRWIREHNLKLTNVIYGSLAALARLFHMVAQTWNRGGMYTDHKMLCVFYIDGKVFFGL